MVRYRPALLAGLLLLPLALPSVALAYNSSVQPPGIVVTVSPSTALLAINTTQQFIATVTGTNYTGVVWSVDGVNGGNMTVGTITSSGLYTAPSLAGGHTVTATSIVNPRASGSASVTVISLTVMPTSATLQPNGMQQFTATVQGTNNQGGPGQWTV